MTPTDVLEISKQAGALLTGHFILTSGRHSDVYFEKFAVLQHPAYLEKLAGELARCFDSEKIDLVVGPTTGGMLLAYEVARQWGKRFLFAEPGENGRVFKRGFTLAPGTRVLVVDDVLTTGRSVAEVLALVRSYGATVAGIGLLLDRSEKPLDFGIAYTALTKVTATSFVPDACPLCQKGLPLTKPGSREQPAKGTAAS